MRRYVVLSLVGSLLFAITAVFIKLASDVLSLAELVFYRSAIGLLFLLPLLLRAGITLASERYALHGVRIVTGMTAMALSFYTISTLPLGTAVTLQSTAPFVIAGLSIVFLGEAMTRRLAASLALGFIAVLIIMRPEGLGGSVVSGLLGLASGIMIGIAMFTLKVLSHTEPPERIILYFTLTATLVGGIWAGLTGFTSIHWQLVPILIGMGLPATFAQWCMTQAYKEGPASTVSALSYANLGFSSIFGIILWHKQPDALGWLGLFLLAFASALAATQSARLSKNHA